jgi:SAM-dependent methyltransferase
VTSDHDRPHHDAELRARRASSFGAHASAYAEHRPDYPVEAVRWALKPVSSPTQLNVLDLAAGTGKLTGVLMTEGHRVTAVEPDEDMLSELCRRHGNVRALPGSAERIPLPDHAVDAVLVGQAFHWFDQERAMPEIARVLRRGGVLAGLWNERDHAVGWVADFAEITRSSVSSIGAAVDVMPPHPEFGEYEVAEFKYSFPRTAESLVETVRTHSCALVIAEEEREALTERMLDFLRSHPETSHGEFEFPITTHGKRTVRR